MKTWLSTVLATLLLATSAHGQTMKLASNDIAHGEFMTTAQEFQGFGCNGSNQSPQLNWSGAPAGTKAFAITAYDPDAPTGSGWWHWQVINIPADVTNLSANAGAIESQNMPKEAQQTRNDYGVHAFGGACPPEGNGVHRYQFTVYALKERLSLPEQASAALTGYMINSNALASATIEALYKR